MCPSQRYELMSSLSSEISLMFGALTFNELKKSNEREKVWKQRRPLHVAEMNMDGSVLREHLQGIWLFTWNCSQVGFTFSTAGAMQDTPLQNVMQLNVYLSMHKQAGHYSCTTIEQQSVD